MDTSDPNPTDQITAELHDTEDRIEEMLRVCQVNTGLVPKSLTEYWQRRLLTSALNKLRHNNVSWNSLTYYEQQYIKFYLPAHQWAAVGLNCDNPGPMHPKPELFSIDPYI